jgi:hypothetical protein
MLTGKIISERPNLLLAFGLQSLTIVLFCFVFISFLLDCVFAVIISIVSDTFLNVKNHSQFEGRKERALMLLEHSNKWRRQPRWLQILTLQRKNATNGTQFVESTQLEDRITNLEKTILDLKAEISTGKQTTAPIVTSNLLPSMIIEKSNVEPFIDEFAVVPARLEIIVRSFETRSFEISMLDPHSKEYADYLLKLGVMPIGLFSPKAQLTLSTAAKIENSIPIEANSFAVACVLQFHIYYYYLPLILHVFQSDNRFTGIH